MKKICFLAVAALFAVSAVNAQEFKKGDWAVNLGVSLDNTDPLVFGGSVERGLVDNLFTVKGLTLGLGAEASFYSKSSGGVKTTGLAVGLRVPFHYSPVARLDLYTAPAILYASAKLTGAGILSESANKTDFGWTIIGARYFFTPKIGIFAELGSNNALGLGAGVALKF